MAQTLVPGMHAMSIVSDVKFTWIIISSDDKISLNLRFTGNGTTPAVTISARALTQNTQRDASTLTLAGSQVLNLGWSSPNSMTIKIEGDSSLFDADVVTVVASPASDNPQFSGPLSSEPPPNPPQTTAPIPDNGLPTTTAPFTTGPSGNLGDCDYSSYPDFCIAPPPPSLNCDDVAGKDFTVFPPDPHGFDRDRDGEGCETSE